MLDRDLRPDVLPVTAYAESLRRRGADSRASPRTDQRWPPVRGRPPAGRDGTGATHPPRKRDLLAKLTIRANAFGGLDCLKIRYRPLVAPFHAVLSHIPPGARLLDIGCGSGVLLYLALEYRRCQIAHGYDISANAVRKAKKLVGNNDRFKARLLKPNSEIPDLADYDVITMVDVLHHVPAHRQRTFLRNIAEAMPSGAVLIVTDIDGSRRVGSGLNQLHDLMLNREWVHPWRASDVVRVLTKCGLEVAKPTRYRSLWYPHYLLIARRP